MTVHFVYVKGSGIETPRAITNELAKRLAKKYEVKVYDWTENLSIKPNEGDILLGHPNPQKNTIFRKSFWNKGWKKRIIIYPFQHYIPETSAFIDPLIVNADSYLAICGKYWIDTIPESLFSHWQPKITRLDLAVRRDHFPFVKQSFAPAGQRRFLYIGNTQKYKGCDYLAEIAEANPHFHIGWIGQGEMPSKRIAAYGYQVFSESSALELISSYDFLLTCGVADPNPTTILEAASWGLIPICTPQSGYYNEDWLVNIPFGDVVEASRILNLYNSLPESQLREYQQLSSKKLENYYNWNRFAEEVIDCIEAPKQDYSSSTYTQDRFRSIANRQALKRIVMQNQLGQFKSRAKASVKRKLHYFNLFRK